MRLSCPATPRLGCYGRLTVTARHRRLRREKRLAYDTDMVELAPGATRTVDLRLSRLACQFERSGDLVNAKIELDSWDRDQSAQRKSRRALRVRGLSACGA